MRKLLLSTAMMAFLFSCDSGKQMQSDIAKLSGTVKDMEDSEIYFRIGDDIDTLKLDSKGNFVFEKEIDKAVNASVFSGRKGMQVFLDKGYDLSFNISKSDLGKAVSFSGIGGEENNLLQESKKISSSINLKNDLYVLSPEEFTSKSDSLMNAQIALVSGKEDVLNPDFVDMFLTDVKYKYLNYYNTYPKAHKYYTGEDLDLGEKAKALIKAGNVDSDKMVSSSEYVKFMSAVLEDEFKKQNDIEDYIENPSEFFKWLKSAVKSDNLRNEMLYSNSKYTITYVDEEDRDQIYKTYSEINTNPELQAKIDKIYSKFEALRKGNMAPKWAYPTIEGKNISLDDLKGNLVYVDVWATWCGPCKAQIPALAKLHDEYKDKGLTVISVSVDDNKAAWEKMITEEAFGWLQVHAEKAWASEIIKANQIKGIPRFMLIDKEGKIISVNAPQPSSENIREYLDQYL